MSERHEDGGFIGVIDLGAVELDEADSGIRVESAVPRGIRSAVRWFASAAIQIFAPIPEAGVTRSPCSGSRSAIMLKSKPRFASGCLPVGLSRGPQPEMKSGTGAWFDSGYFPVFPSADSKEGETRSYSPRSAEFELFRGAGPAPIDHPRYPHPGSMYATADIVLPELRLVHI